MAGLIGLGIAFEELEEHFDHVAMETARLKGMLEKGQQVLFEEHERLPTTCALSFPGIRGELMAFYLSHHGVLATFGGGRTQTLADPCAVSFALSRETTEEEITRAIGIIEEGRELYA